MKIIAVNIVRKCVEDVCVYTSMHVCVCVGGGGGILVGMKQ